MRFFRRTRRPKEWVDIDPLQLVAVQFLLRFSSASMDNLFLEVSNARPDIPREMFDSSIADAVAQGIVDYQFDTVADTTSLVLTPLGRRLRGKLPSGSRSRLRVYL